MLDDTDKRKIAQILHLILRLRGRSEGYTKLLKLLYLVDTAAMREWHTTVTRDDHYALMNGPVLMDTHDLLRAVKRGGLADPIFAQYLERSSPQSLVHAKEVECDYDELSPAERDLVERVVRKHGRKSTGELIRYTHKFGEWLESGGSRVRLTTPMIASAISRDRKEMAAIIDGVQQGAALDALWGS